MQLLSKLRDGFRRPAAPASVPRDVAGMRDVIFEEGLDAARALRLAEALEREGKRIAAIEAYTVANRLRRNPEVESHLVRLRRDAFHDLDLSLPAPVWPPALPEPKLVDSCEVRGKNGPLVIDADQLSAGVLRRGILRHGAVWVRGLVPQSRVARLIDAIDAAFEGFDRFEATRESSPPSFQPLDNICGQLVRGFARKAGGVLAADAPRGLYEFLETVYELGLDDLISRYLGERIAISTLKTTLRRVDHSPSNSYWHQDGAFMGDGIRTVNTWIALSKCGIDAPGMDLLPLRLDRLLPTGEDGVFDWAVAASTITRELPDVEIWRPEFNAGDALFFDHMFLHRTAAEPHMKLLRYAIECWFFAASHYPEDKTVPLLV